ncbi:uncharacterized protein LOC107607026 [Arachis ipaensis]|uniref:uncharacterized protein LOC107607026 n=1 Tax=Arachis ipaensis TaxID=130454 RepID=UPI0007AF06CE|nr:uncharacterized protein LOC107607026 [Arachis ipaensis]
MAMEAWNRLRDIFQDNKHSHAIILEYDFTHVDMIDFPNVYTYCQHLKSLSDQLKNIGSLVDNNKLVLQLVFGLADPYKGVTTLIRQSDPLPQFYQAHSMLNLEDADLSKKAAHSSSSAMVDHFSNGSHDIPNHASSNHNIMVERGTKTVVIMEGKITATMVVVEAKRGEPAERVVPEMV